MRMPSPGPGNGWRFQNVGRYLELTAYTAHLVLEKQSERLDDLQIHFSGRPPTLWCDLIVADGPLTDTDSITSG